MRQIAVFRDGQLIGVDGEMIADAPKPSRAVAVAAPVERVERVEREPPRQVVALDPVDEIAGLLARTIHLAQGLDEIDARRARDLMHAASAALSASTYLPKDLQRRFNTALRNAK